MSDDPINLGAHRASKDQSPQAWSPYEMLIHAAHAIERGESKPDHVIVVFGNVGSDGATDCSYQQAGKFDAFGGLGLVDRIMDMMRRPQ